MHVLKINSEYIKVINGAYNVGKEYVFKTTDRYLSKDHRKRYGNRSISRDSWHLVLNKVVAENNFHRNKEHVKTKLNISQEF